MRKIIFLTLLICGQIGYAQKLKPISTQTIMKVKKILLTEVENKNWWHYDIEKDSIPGISLDRAYKEIIRGKKGKEVVVAVLDTKLDIHHIELKDRIWTNKNEIPNNGIDDDKNGYIDDVNGWNFLGNAKGEDQIHQSSEAARIVKSFDAVFRNLKKEEIPAKKFSNFQLYQEAKKYLKKDLDEINNQLLNLRAGKSRYQKAQNTIGEILSKKIFTIKSLDSLLKTNNKLKDEIKFLKIQLNYNMSLEDFRSMILSLESKLNRNHNLNFNDREFINDNQNEIKDRFYGNSNVSRDISFDHSSLVSGVISADRNNDIGLIGILNDVKIMPIVMITDGDGFDKDIALGIRYAVDNGADIINMSWGKSISMNQEWVKDAILYASKKNVLLVTSSGNENTNIDTDYHYYPIDYNEESEFVNSFLSIGASNVMANENLKASFSNYGILNVDLFAPGNNIYTTSPHDKYENTGGTSLATPITSGVAALLKSYYPQLTAGQLKEILLASAVKYDFDVSVRIGKEKEQINFKKLSKSGGIVNAYNALLLAEELKN